MQTQPQITPAQWLAIGIFLVAIVTALLSISRAREGIRYKFRRSLVPVAIYVLTVAVLLRFVHVVLLVAVVVGVFIALMLDNIFRPQRRSRHIPRYVRRKLIADWERRHGMKFNPREYELDHHVPFSRGGSSTTDNLKVRSRQFNRSKGARRPWWYWG